MNQFTHEFTLLLRACYPLIYIPTAEEERVEKAIASVVKQLGNRNIYTWDFVDGYQDNPNNANFARRNPLQALELVEKLPEKAGGSIYFKGFSSLFRRYIYLA